MSVVRCPVRSRWIAVFAAGFVRLYPRFSPLDAIRLARRVYRLAPGRDAEEALRALTPSRKVHRAIVSASRAAILETLADRTSHRDRIRRSEHAIEESLRLLGRGDRV